MAGRTTAVRAAAERRARDIRVQREALRKRREAQIDAALADFFEASARADQIKRDAAQKAAALLDRAEKEAAKLRDDASRAIHTLRGLGQTNAEISEATGLSIGAVRTAAMRGEEGSAADGSEGPTERRPSGGASAVPAEAATGVPSSAMSNAGSAWPDSSSDGTS